LETFVWKKSYGGGAKSKHVVNLHEYVLCFAKDKDCIPALDLPPDEKAIAYYKFRDAKYETRGPYRLQPLATNSMDPRPNLRYAIPWKDEEIWPEKQWQWSKDRALAALADDGLVIAKKAGKWTVSYKQYLKDNEGAERRSKAYSIIEAIYTQQGTNEIADIFGDGKAFSFPKPRKLLELFIGLVTDKGSLILDSFAGSGTTAHAVLAQNKADGGTRRFITIEMDETICRDVTAQRIRKAIEGYGDTPALGGGFRYCKLAEPLFDASGQIRQEVTFAELAAHIYFTETGEPIPKRPTGKSALIGVYRGTAYYLLFNGVLGDKRPGGGNVLTAALLAELPPHEGPRVIYGEGCRLGRARLERERIIFKQVPYEVKVS